ncbi:MAG: PD40 domain-containing protein [Verrucomicrobia bacterium]|nr:PD40 domain-containing protein [Verrucomicrobiota bacterium]MDE3100363.1 PD40 domain-containing protein [Verrucomicrobiota bacterium]
MKTRLQILSLLLLCAAIPAAAQNEQSPILIQRTVPVLGFTPPIPVSLEGFTGVAARVLNFDLYVQGFIVVPPAQAQYHIRGTDAVNVSGTVALANHTILARSYAGGNTRAQAHAFANDIVQAITGKLGISLLRGSVARIVFKAQAANGNGKIYVSDFDGANAQAVTAEDTIVAAPVWTPDRLAIYYTSYQLGNPDVFYHDLTTGRRRVVAGFSGLNTSASVSPDGTRVAMILSKSGSPNVWVCDANGSHWKQLTDTAGYDSSPCWSPDGRWICFATEIRGRRELAKVPASGGQLEIVRTPGAPNPTDPAWSPDGKWIAFTCQMGEFDICVMPANGSAPPMVLVRGQHPSWAPNSRTLIFNRPSGGYEQTLSVLDVFTKHVKDIPRISGSDSEAEWAE